MSEEWEVTHAITDEMQRAFVRFSGDSNPLHTDPVVARRLPFGRVAVHGMHLALDALDRLAGRTSRPPTHIRCTFRRSVGVGDELTTRFSMTPDGARIIVEHDVWRVAELRVLLAAAATDPPEPTECDGVEPPEPAEPAEHSASTIPTLSGSIGVRADLPALRERFPHLVGVLGTRGGAELVSLSRLVGMVVPGLHSLFSSLDVELRDDREAPDGFDHRVQRFDERFSKATIDVTGRVVRGTVVAFLRPRPVVPDIARTRPRPGDFAGQRWLVVGGSRGLGAITALLLSAGGGDVRITYRIGVDDADRLAASMGATARQLDVTAPGPGMASILADGWHPTHVAFFASPPIFDGGSGVYSTKLEERFRSVFIDGFDAVLGHLELERLVGVLWPSTEAADHNVPGLAEYAAVKRSGEQRCAALAREHDHLIVVSPRLPRLRTDQTASFVPVDYDDAPSTMLRVLRAFSG